MRLLLYGLNFAPEPTGVGKFSGEMAAWLAARGHELRAVVAPPYYPLWRRDRSFPPFREEIWQGVRVYRAPLYVPDRPTGTTRVAHLLSFAATSLPLAWWHAVSFHPEVLIAVAPTLMTAPGAMAAAALTGAKTWLHVQDFETDAAFGLGLLGGSGPREAALASERLILRRFNRVSTISEPMRRSLIMKGVAPDRTRLLPNWTDLTSIRPFDSTSPLRAELGIPADTVVALYAGTLGEKQGLEILAEVASRLESPPEIVIAVAGDGPGRTRLAEAAASSPRLRLLPLQPIERLNDLLNVADMHLLPERAEAADLVMPSKLGGMLASGRPVIAAVRPDGAIATAVADAGIVVPPGDVVAIATAMVQLARDPARRSGLGRAARRIAERNWDRHAILQRFEKELMLLIR